MLRRLADVANSRREKHKVELKAAEKAQRAYEEGPSATHVSPNVLRPVVSTFLRSGPTFLPLPGSPEP